MNAKERVRRTIRRESVDRAPYGFDMTSVIQEKLAAYFGVSPNQIHAYIDDNLQYLYHVPPTGFISETIGTGRYMDEFGVVWDKGDGVRSIGDWGGIIASPLEEPELNGYRFPDPHAPGRFRGFDDVEVIESDRYLVLHMDGLFDLGWHVRGFENLMMDFACEEKAVDELLDKALEFNLGLIEEVPRHVNGIRFGEDWGQQRGLMMGGRIWRRFLKPRLEKMYAAAHARGFDVLIHSCGDITELFPDLIGLGIDVVHPIQPEVMDVALIKREYGKHIVLYGGLGCQSTIPLGTVAEVLSEAKERLKLLGRGGGYIFGPAGAIPTEAKIENVVALVEFARNGYI